MSEPVTSTRILVVDDEPSIVDSVATVLRYEGFEVDVAHSGRTAIEKVTTGSFDLIVLDVMLPDLDGLEVTRRIRADGLDVPILFLTATLRSRGPHRGTDHWCGRLRRQALFAHGDRRSDPAPSCVVAFRARQTTGCGSPTSSWTRKATRCGAAITRSD